MTGGTVIGRPERQSRFALRFFFVAAALFACAVGLAAALTRLLPCSAPAGGQLVFPRAFLISTLLIGTGSVALQRALGFVRVERQRLFRRSLIAALAAGTGFVGCQGAGLYCVLEAGRGSDFSTGVAVFVFMLGFLHAMHLTVALLFLTFVTLKALADRYDHEYYWGVVVCAWFWHFLGIVWLGILCVFAITLGPG